MKNQFKYKYVFSWFKKQPKKYEDFNFVGCETLNEIAGLAANLPKGAKFYVYSKAEANKKGIIPTICCSYPKK